MKQSYYRRKRHGASVVTASRGCPLQCSYCSMGADSQITYRRRSVASVIREIEDAVLRQGAGFVDFEDENLSLDRAWFLRLLSAIRRRFAGKVLELRAMNGLLPSTLDNEIVCAMQQAGFKTMNLSLGSTSEAQLKRFRRPDVRKAFETALDLAARHGLGAVGYVIAGAPYQDPEATIADLLFLAARRVLAGLSIFYPAPGSADYQLCDRLGLLPDRFALLRSSCLPLSHATSRSQAATLLRLSRILNFMKLLVDRGISIPEPRSFPPEVSLDPRHRLETGLTLLSWFLRDGIIRGVGPDGVPYQHPANHRLTGMFIDGMDRITVRGSG